jgi:hypothetical protein
MLFNAYSDHHAAPQLYTTKNVMSHSKLYSFTTSLENSQNKKKKCLELRNLLGLLRKGQLKHPHTNDSLLLTRTRKPNAPFLGYWEMNDERLDKYKGWETREGDEGIEKGMNRGKETVLMRREDGRGGK